MIQALMYIVWELFFIICNLFLYINYINTNNNDIYILIYIYNAIFL